MGWTREEMLEEASYDEQGRLSQVEIQWDRRRKKGEAGPEYVILGTLKIDKNEMIVQTNSEERAKKLKKEIEKRLKGRARLIRKEVKNLDEIVATDPDEKESLPDEPTKPYIEDPKLRAVIEETFKEHWDEWLDSEIPAFGGRTPRETAKTTEGRELLEVALQKAVEYTKQERDEKMLEFRLDLINKVRKELVLDSLG